MAYNQPPQCPHCQADLVEKQGKKGKFWTCPNWKRNNSGCEGTIWFPPQEKSGPKNGPKETNQEEKILNAIRIVNDNIIGLHKKIDKLLE